MTAESVPRPFSYFASAVFALGVVMLTVVFRMDALRLSPQVLLVIIAALLSENFALRVSAFSISLFFPLFIAALLVGGPSAAVVAAAVSFTNWDEIRQRRPWAAMLFNLGQLVLSAGFGALSFWSTHAPSMHVGFGLVPLGPSSAASALFGVMVAALVFAVVNTLLTSMAVTLGRGMPFRVVVRSLLQYVPTQLALALVGFLIAQVLAVSTMALPLFLLPLFLARQTYQRYAEMRDVYLDTVRSLVGALEAKDPYTSGHSERVAEYCRRIGEQLHLDARSLELVEQAGLLHDIGKLSVTASVLAKPASLTPDEYASIMGHPAGGASMVARLPLLRGLAPIVSAHHERLDGGGYPSGLAGSAIPYEAKIVAVADAYDAMTSHRPYRLAMHADEAFAELRSASGRQFDGTAVLALQQALESADSTRHLRQRSASAAGVLAESR